MITYNTSFVFKISHSIRGYQNKNQINAALSSSLVNDYNKSIEDPEDRLVKMAFVQEEISIDRFVDLATSGYSFCNLFEYDPELKYMFKQYRFKNYIYPEYKRGKNKGGMKMQIKSDRFFSGTQCFFVDIDYTKYNNVEDFIRLLRMKPTVTYMSFSDGEFKIDERQRNNPEYDPYNGIKSRRFRLCYIFEEVIYGDKDYQQISKSIHRMIEDSTKEKIQDKCGLKASQYFNGSQNKEVYVTGIVYNRKDFIPDDPLQSNLQKAKDNTISDVRETILDSIGGTEDQGKKDISYYLISDMKKDEYDEFMKKYSHRFRFYYRKDDGLWEDGYQIVGDDYFELYYNVSRIKDGQKRRRKLFERMCLRRVMFPDITPDEVLFCAYVELNKIIDNEIDPITVECLVTNVRQAFSLSIEKIKNIYGESIQKLQEQSPKRRLIYDLSGAITPAQRNTMMGEIRSRYYDKMYDSTLSVKENAEKMGVCEKTVRRYCKKRAINTNHMITDDELRQMIDPVLSGRKNSAIIREKYDVRVSTKRVTKVLQQMKNELGIATESHQYNNCCQFFIITNGTSVGLNNNTFFIDASVDSSIMMAN